MVSYITGPEIVKYACTCGLLKLISQLYFCRYCTQLRCNFCLCHEVDSIFCGKCSETIPSSEARLKKHRCGNCNMCPNCGQDLTVRVASKSSTKTEETKAAPRKMHYLVCFSCHWSSRDVGMPDQPSVSGTWPERENPNANHLKQLIDTYKAMVLSEKQQKEKQKKKQRLKYISYSEITGVTAAELRKRIGLSADAVNPVLKNKPKWPESAKGTEEIPELPESVFTDPVDLMNITTIDQRLMQLEHQPETIDKLMPVQKQLSIKRSLRCRKCEHNVSKPEYNPASVKFKIQLFAYYHVPEVTFVTVEPLRAGKPSELILKFTNPTQHQTTITFFNLNLDEVEEAEPEIESIEQTPSLEDRSLSSLSEPSSLIKFSSRQPSITVKPRKIEEKVNCSVAIPQTTFILPPRDDAAEYDDSGEASNIQDDTKLVIRRKSNKAYIRLTVTPDDVPLESDITCGFIMQHVYTNIIVKSFDNQQVHKYDHKIKVFLSLGKLVGSE